MWFWCGDKCASCAEECYNCADSQSRHIVTSQPRRLLEQELQQSRREIQHLQQENVRLQEDVNTYQTRLSQIVSAKITDNNPSVVNLGDRNRPNKLGERYSELYTNEWTDAYDSLEKDAFSNEQAIEALLNILVTSYKHSQEKARIQLEALSCFGGMDKLPVEVAKGLKESRKVDSTYKSQIRKVETDTLGDKWRNIQLDELPHITPDGLPEFDLVTSEPNVERVQANCPEGTQQEVIQHLDFQGVMRERVARYLHECVSLTWLMAIQDPPMVLDDPSQVNGKPFNKNIYREYITAGAQVKYVVWPAMFINDGGNLLKKGVVEGHDLMG